MKILNPPTPWEGDEPPSTGRKGPPLSRKKTFQELMENEFYIITIPSDSGIRVPPMGTMKFLSSRGIYESYLVSVPLSEKEKFEEYLAFNQNVTSWEKE